MATYQKSYVRAEPLVGGEYPSISYGVTGDSIAERTVELKSWTYVQEGALSSSSYLYAPRYVGLVQGTCRGWESVPFGVDARVSECPAR